MARRASQSKVNTFSSEISRSAEKVLRADVFAMRRLRIQLVWRLVRVCSHEISQSVHGNISMYSFFYYDALFAS